eukprot:TRINITY_DN87077_c0_g1_i1.p1 TRINITY_DN87077_c0_g1~~TRINITY_DN87077_c0_g1_i1.p1  ORF type:complete len:128 (-),score=0.20 TRINITY_DN87077_c0_g1_i1:135-494(-)
MIDYIYSLYHKDLKEFLENNPYKLESKFSCDWYAYKLEDMGFAHHFNIPAKKIGLCISNLISFGLIRWAIDVDIDNPEVPNSYSGETKININVQVIDDEYIKITKLGVGFVELCKFKTE